MIPLLPVPINGLPSASNEIAYATSVGELHTRSAYPSLAIRYTSEPPLMEALREPTDGGRPAGFVPVRGVPAALAAGGVDGKTGGGPLTVAAPDLVPTAV